jgi:hypothetical protein
LKNGDGSSRHGDNKYLFDDITWCT